MNEVLLFINEWAVQAAALFGGSSLVVLGRFVKKNFPKLITATKDSNHKAVKEMKAELKAEMVAEFRPTLELMKEKTAIDLEANIKNPTVSAELTAKYKALRNKLL